MGQQPQSNGAMNSPEPPQAPQTPMTRLIGTLALAGAMAGLLIVVVYELTLPAIEEKRARELAEGVGAVLQQPASFKTLHLYEGQLVEDLPEGVDPRGIERIYLGFREDGSRIGFAIPAAEPGYVDYIGIIFGYDPETREVLGMRVLESNETPGLGDKIETDEGFLSTLIGGRVPLKGVSPGTAEEPDEVNMITGATISARTVVQAINKAIERWEPYLEDYRESPAEDGAR